MTLVLWTLFYAVPAACAVYLKRNFKRLRDRVLVMHAGMLVSVLLLSTVATPLVWNATALALAAFIAGATCAVLLLGREGLPYALSSFLQEWCLLLAGSFLAVYGLLFAAIATSLVYTLAHRLTAAELPKKFPILFLWGAATVFLYQYAHMPLINIAVHAAAGAFFIRRGFALGGY